MIKGVQCPNPAEFLIKVILREVTSPTKRAEFIPGFSVCGPHIPDGVQIGPNMIEAISKELDEVGGKRPYSVEVKTISVTSAEARDYFASKGN